MAEPYNSPGSPYWALKFFLPLALPDSHPFWTSEEQPLPQTPAVVVQKKAGLVLYHDDVQVVALAMAQPTEWMHDARWMRHAPAKYCKFAYSTLFGFSVPAGDIGLAHGAHDSMLALSEEGDYWRARTGNAEARIEGNVLYARWRPWPDVEIETWLIPNPPWHIRVHKLKTGRHLFSAEGGFATSKMDEVLKAGRRLETGVGFARSLALSCASGIRDLNGQREGEINFALPNTNLLYPKSIIPMLKGEHAPGEHTLICAVLGALAPSPFETHWEHPPRLRHETNEIRVDDAKTSAPLFAWKDDAPARAGKL